MKRWTWILIASFLLATPASARAYLVDRVEAVVNGRVITMSEVDRAVRAEALRRGVKTEGDCNKLRTEALGVLIDRTLLLEEARRFNIVQVSDEEVERAFETVRKGFSSDSEFRKALRQDDLTEEGLKNDLRDQILTAPPS